MLREDNADIRLARYGAKFGLLDKEIADAVDIKRVHIQKALEDLKNEYVTPTKEFSRKLENIGEEKIRDKTAMIDVIGRLKDLSIEKLLVLAPDLKSHTEDILEQILIESKYSRYIQKQRKQIEKMQEMYEIEIPEGFDFTLVKGLSNEIVEKLQKVSPPTLFEASRISGVTPAAIEILHIYIKMRGKSD